MPISANCTTITAGLATAGDTAEFQSRHNFSHGTDWSDQRPGSTTRLDTGSVLIDQSMLGQANRSR
jgi:hypothetical protein